MSLSKVIEKTGQKGLVAVGQPVLGQPPSAASFKVRYS